MSMISQLGALADKVVISNATGCERLFLEAVRALIAGVRVAQEQACTEKPITDPARIEAIFESDFDTEAGRLEQL